MPNGHVTRRGASGPLTALASHGRGESVLKVLERFGSLGGTGTTGAVRRHTFGGLTDAAFSVVPLLERGRDARWPWEG
ncbi:hypothetical protein GO001_32310 [Streptomyces sp. NRRL B-1677]|nr:hypothetical protein [Streptomyces sp. NRRL B-1677]